MTLTEWAKRHAISLTAFEELQNLLEGPGVAHGVSRTGSEADASQHCRLLAQEQGARLWRNNVGAGELSNGLFMRWGLCNESKVQNAHIKSADLIGIQPVVITPGMIGQTLGQFVAREMKEPGWRYRGDDHEEAQARFLQLVNLLGGDGKFSTGGY